MIDASNEVGLCHMLILCYQFGSGPALGMFELFGRTGPLILGGRLFGR